MFTSEAQIASYYYGIRYNSRSNIKIITRKYDLWKRHERVAPAIMKMTIAIKNNKEFSFVNRTVET